MPFRKWVAAQGGVTAVALLIGVSRPTVHGWLRGEAPKLLHLKRMVDASEGRLTYRNLIAEFTKAMGG